MKKRIGSTMRICLLFYAIIALSSCYKSYPIMDTPDADVPVTGDSDADADADADADEDIEWIRITGGTFNMGSENGQTNESPEHTVRVPDFEMMKTEVTVSEFVKCVSAGACEQADWTSNSNEDDCNLGGAERADHPMNCVSWFGAVAYCAWAGGRLPTEAEWEYAARSSGKNQAYPWGDDKATCENAVISGDGDHGYGRGTTWPGCSKLLGNTNEGLCDMVGNVWEWVRDDWHENYTGAPTDGSAWITGEAERVVREGSWGQQLNSSGNEVRGRSRTITIV